MLPQSPLHQALCEALDDEYKARATYQAVIAAFGPVLPFANVIQSEQRHIDALLSLLAARGLPAIADPYASGLAAPSSIQEACSVGVEAEIENAALYDRLMDAAVGDEEVLWVFHALRRASAECHLPAFRRGLEGHLTDSCGDGHSHQGGRCCGGHRRNGHRGRAPTLVTITDATVGGL
jgi:hypothetical protein